MYSNLCNKCFAEKIIQPYPDTVSCIVTIHDLSFKLKMTSSRVERISTARHNRQRVSGLIRERLCESGRERKGGARERA